MDETSLRALFEGAVASRPRTPDLVVRSLRAGRRLRMRRRLVAGTALVVAIGGISAAPFAYGAHARVPHTPPPAMPSLKASGTGYIPTILEPGSDGRDRSAVVPMNLTSNKADRPIVIPGYDYTWALEAAPDGKMLYSAGSALTPIDLASQKAERPITLPGAGLVAEGTADGESFVITPDGRHAYVALPDEIVPVDLVTRRAEAPITTNYIGYVTIAPNGRVAYGIKEQWVKSHERVTITPVSLAARKSLTPVTVTTGYLVSAGGPATFSFSLDGRTAYWCGVTSGNNVAVIRINTATNTVLPLLVRPIPASRSFAACSVSFSGDGRTAFVAVPGEVLPIDVATGATRSPLMLPELTGITWLQKSADGRYVYAIGVTPEQHWRITIVPIEASTLTALKPVSFSVPGSLNGTHGVTVAPDGVAYACTLGRRSAILIPVSLATGRQGPPIPLPGAPEAALTIYPG